MQTTHDLLDQLIQHKAAINLATTEQKNKALSEMANALEANVSIILEANAQDLENAKHTVSEVMLDRLRLTHERIIAMADGIRALIPLADPVGITLEQTTRDNGLLIEKRSIPFGVIGMIYESRPNVTSDAAALAVKSGNAIILRGGKEAFHSSQAIVNALKSGLCLANLSEQIIALVQDTSRQSAMELMQAKGKLDLLIPRGGAGLIQSIVQNATVPVIETGTGICHIYVDKHTNLEQALAIVVNAKTSRPSVCNAMEVLVVHEGISPTFLPQLEQALAGKVQLRADKQALMHLQEGILATEDDFNTEFLDYILAIKTVSSVDDAIHHINTHSTQHSEAIISDDVHSCAKFTQHIDSAAVYVNASTRFTDGGEFGLGCELGISTQKMHARGPMGLREMTTYKYIIQGSGQVR